MFILVPYEPSYQHAISVCHWVQVRTVVHRTIYDRCSKQRIVALSAEEEVSRLLSSSYSCWWNSRSSSREKNKSPADEQGKGCEEGE